MKHLYWLCEEAVSAETCDRIIAQSNRDLQVAEVFNGSDVRRSRISFTVPDEAKEICNWHINNANRLAFGFDVSGATEHQFTEYDSAYVGNYDWHVDCFVSPDLMFDRKLSCVVFLSDPDSYEGGELCIGPDDVLKAKKGSVVVFPSFIMHKVNDVTGGVRYSLVSWVEGLPFR